MKLYKILAAGRRSCHGGEAVWEPGVWMPARKVKVYSSGYHLCRRRDLASWLHDEIWEAEGRGEYVVADDKVVYAEARITRRLTQWTPMVAALFAADCAERVLYLFEKLHSNDDRPRLSIAASRQYPFGHPARAAARDAAWEAAEEAARAAAGAAAWAAARAAAWAAAGAAAWAAARAAARAAAWEAAEEAAWAAAGAAARDAEREWQTARLCEYLEIEKEVGDAR